MGSRQEMDPFSIYQCLIWASSSSYSLRYPHKSQGKSLFEEEQISWQCKKAAYRPKKISTDKLCVVTKRLLVTLARAVSVEWLGHKILCKGW